MQCRLCVTGYPSPTAASTCIRKSCGCQVCQRMYLAGAWESFTPLALLPQVQHHLVSECLEICVAKRLLERLQGST